MAPCCCQDSGTDPLRGRLYSVKICSNADRLPNCHPTDGGVPVAFLKVRSDRWNLRPGSKSCTRRSVEVNFRSFRLLKPPSWGFFRGGEGVLFPANQRVILHGKCKNIHTTEATSTYSLRHAPRLASYSHRTQVEISVATRENIFRKMCKIGLPVAVLFFHLERLGCLGGASTGGECLQVGNGECRPEMVLPIRQALMFADGGEYSIAKFMLCRHRRRATLRHGGCGPADLLQLSHSMSSRPHE